MKDHNNILAKYGYTIKIITENRICNICGLNSDQAIFNNLDQSINYYCSRCTPVFISKLDYK